VHARFSPNASALLIACGEEGAQATLYKFDDKDEMSFYAFRIDAFGEIFAIDYVQEAFVVFARHGIAYCGLDGGQFRCRGNRIVDSDCQSPTHVVRGYGDDFLYGCSNGLYSMVSVGGTSTYAAFKVDAFGDSRILALRRRGWCERASMMDVLERKVDDRCKLAVTTQVGEMILDKLVDLLRVPGDAYHGVEGYKTRETWSNQRKARPGGVSAGFGVHTSPILLDSGEYFNPATATGGAEVRSEGGASTESGRRALVHRGRFALSLGNEIISADAANGLVMNLDSGRISRRRLLPEGHANAQIMAVHSGDGYLYVMYTLDGRRLNVQISKETGEQICNLSTELGSDDESASLLRDDSVRLVGVNGEAGLVSSSRGLYYFRATFEAGQARCKNASFGRLNAYNGAGLDIQSDGDDGVLMFDGRLLKRIRFQRSADKWEGVVLLNLDESKSVAPSITVHARPGISRPNNHRFMARSSGGVIALIDSAQVDAMSRLKVFDSRSGTMSEVNVIQNAQSVVGAGEHFVVRDAGGADKLIAKTGVLIHELAWNAGDLIGMVNLGSDRFILVASLGVYLYSVKDPNPMLQVHANESGYIAISRDGFWAGENPERLVSVAIGEDRFDLAMVFDVFYRPDLIASTILGGNAKSASVETLVNLLRTARPPRSAIQEQSRSLVEGVASIKYFVKDEGGGVGEVLVFHNGKLIKSDGYYRDAPGSTLVAMGATKTSSAATVAAAMRKLLGEGEAVPAGATGASRVRNSVVIRQAKPKVLNAAGEYHDSVEIEVIPGEDNEVTVMARNAENSILGQGQTVRFKSTLAKAEPHLWVLPVGIGSFADRSVPAGLHKSAALPLLHEADPQATI
jgi:hypothetical protein